MIGDGSKNGYDERTHHDEGRPESRFCGKTLKLRLDTGWVSGLSSPTPTSVVGASLSLSSEKIHGDPVMSDGMLSDDTLTIRSSNVRGVKERVLRTDSPRGGRDQCSGVDRAKTL